MLIINYFIINKQMADQSTFQQNDTETKTKNTSNSPTNEDVIELPVIIVHDEKNTSQDSQESDKPSKNDYTFIDSKKIRKQIIVDIIYPNYIDDLTTQYKWRTVWGIFASIFFTLATIVMLASTFLSFVSSYYKEPIYAFVAGCVGISAVVTDRFAHFCDSRNSNSTKKINALLKSIGINDAIPDISDLTTVTSKNTVKEEDKKETIHDVNDDIKKEDKKI